MRTKKLKLNFKITAVLAVFVLVFLVAGNIFAIDCDKEPRPGLCKAQTGLTGTATEGYGKAPESDISTSIGTIVGSLLAFVGVIFLILMIYGGFLWMTAAGNEQQTAKAKDLITMAIIGLIIVMSAYAITAYVGGILSPATTG